MAGAHEEKEPAAAGGRSRPGEVRKSAVVHATARRYVDVQERALPQTLRDYRRAERCVSGVGRRIVLTRGWERANPGAVTHRSARNLYHTQHRNIAIICNSIRSLTHPLIYTFQFGLWQLAAAKDGSRSVKILVCMKQVPQKDAPLKLNDAGTWIRDDVSYEVNEPDAFALEEALRQREKHKGEVVVVTAGPARAMQVLREALAKGADRAIHLEGDAFVGLDAYNTARAIAAAIKDETFDLIFTGLQSDDYGYAQTGVILAEILGWPHATIIMQIEKSDGGIKVKRELEAGFFQHVDMPLPAVLTIQSGINKLRYATLIGIKQAKNKPLRKVTMDEVKSALGDNMQKIEKLYIPQKSKNTEFLEGSPTEVAKKLVDRLKNEMRVI